MAAEKRVIPGYGGAYSVGRDGSVWRNGSELRQFAGYVNLSWRGVMSKVKVCYLVARAWVPNSAGKEWVRHVNGDPADNRAENLEWSERKEERRGRKGVDWGAVSVWRKADGALVGSWSSLKEACLDLGVEEKDARRVLRGAGQSTKGYIFKS